MKQLLKRLFEKIFGVQVFRTLPFGLDPLYDIRQCIKGYKVDTVFDVGANIGQSAESIRKIEPTARIYCFEPSRSTFETLKKNTAHLSNIYYHNLAFGDERKTIQLVHGDSSDQNRIVAGNDKNADSEAVNMDTLSGFCKDNKIDHISYLKIDTEGYDLHVIKSGADLLEGGSVDFVEVEVGMNPTNELHVPFEEVKSYMEQKRYYLFGIYEQKHEWKMKKAYLRRCNAVFLSQKMAATAK